MTTYTHNTVLTLNLRAKVAADSGIGGGNLVSSMLAINPYPDEPFIQSLIPVAYTIGTEFKPAARLPLETVVHWEQW